MKEYKRKERVCFFEVFFTSDFENNFLIPFQGRWTKLNLFSRSHVPKGDIRLRTLSCIQTIQSVSVDQLTQPRSRDVVG